MSASADCSAATMLAAGLSMPTVAHVGCSPETSIMLGDTLFDLLCAKNAGVRSTLVSWSLALHGMTKEDLGEAAPDYIIQKPEELLEIIA